MAAMVISELHCRLGAAEVLQDGACPFGQNPPDGMADLANEAPPWCAIRKHGGHQKHRGKQGEDRGESSSLGHGKGVVLKGPPQRQPKMFEEPHA